MVNNQSKTIKAVEGKTKIGATIVADSICPRGHRITSLEIILPRYILAELNTHRALSKNSASSRAIPFKKMVQMVKESPFIPIAWQKEHKGMQGTEYIEDRGILEVKNQQWLNACMYVIQQATQLNQNSISSSTSQEIENSGVTKQICNRLLEPFMWHKVLITGTDEGWENFFRLRCPQYSPFEDRSEVFRSKKDCIINVGARLPGLEEANLLEWLYMNDGQADIHMMALAEAIYDAMKDSTPQQLKPGEWHIPYGDKIASSTIFDTINLGDTIVEWIPIPGIDEGAEEWRQKQIIKIATGMCARTSYTTVGDEKEVNYETLIGIHDKMLQSVPFHASPFEHIAQCPTDEDYYHHSDVKVNPDRTIYCGWFRNFHGWKQYRQIVEDGQASN